MEAHVDLEELEAQNTEFRQFNSVQGTIAVTSRISVQKLVNIFSQFTDFKRQLVRDIGFGGVLGIKPLPMLNLKFSSCLMEKVNPDTKEILIDDDRGIKFFPKDVSNVFGIPCGTKKISTYPTKLSKACAEFKKIAEEMSDKGVHSLKAAEAILVKHLDTDSPAIDIDMFKIAAVIFVVGHMLCPSSKNDYTSVDYWEALSTTAEISEYNWSEFVVEHLLSAVRKLKCDLQTRTLYHTSNWMPFVSSGFCLGQFRARIAHTARHLITKDCSF
uniref:Aminotransferase-like plant mobile domain-containing protein n=1 Tax=Hordeum vulgare subsp. vulgare TaxID=112509 RepID=A0A8I6Z1L6_HORVV